MNRFDRVTPERASKRAALPEAKRRQMVRETVAAMTETERLAVAVSYYEQIGPEGIAFVLEIEPSEAARRLTVGTQRLTQTLLRAGDLDNETHRSSAP